MCDKRRIIHTLQRLTAWLIIEMAPGHNNELAAECLLRLEGQQPLTNPPTSPHGFRSYV